MLAAFGSILKMIGFKELIIHVYHISTVDFDQHRRNFSVIRPLQFGLTNGVDFDDFIQEAVEVEECSDFTAKRARGVLEKYDVQ